MPLLLVLLSAGLLIFSCPPFNISSLSWFCLVPILLIKDKSPWYAFYKGYLLGLIVYAVLFYWIVWYKLWVYLIVVVTLGSFWAFFFFYLKLLNINTSTIIITPSALYISLKLIYSVLPLDFGTFWADIGYSQINNTHLLKLSQISGIDTINFLILMSNFVIYGILSNLWAVNRKHLINLTIFLLILGAGIFYIHSSSLYSHKFRAKSEKTLTVAAIQGNFAQSWQWRQNNAKYILYVYKKLIKEASIFKPNIVLLPEYAIPADIINNKYYLYELLNLIKNYNFYLIIGAYTYYNNKKYNIAVILSPNGILTKDGNIIDIKDIDNNLAESIYTKVLPIPFGEKGVYKGYMQKPFSINKDLKIGIIICYEDTESQIARRQVMQGAQILFFLANDAHFRHTFLVKQHAILSKAIAIENKRPVVRLANTGITWAVDSNARHLPSFIRDVKKKKGYLSYQTSLNQQQILITYVKLNNNNFTFTLYTKYGNTVLIFFCGLLTLILGAKRLFTKTHNEV